MLKPLQSIADIRTGHTFRDKITDDPQGDVHVLQIKDIKGRSIVRAGDLSSAIKIENASAYGNAASVFTESGGTARYVMEHASAGMIGVNVGVPVPREPFSFGGWNDSRFGVGDITGRGSIEFWTKSKKMTTKWNREHGTNWMS